MQKKQAGNQKIISRLLLVSALTQKDLRNMISLADTVISAYEREARNITVRTFLRIAEICDFVNFFHFLIISGRFS